MEQGMKEFTITCKSCGSEKIYLDWDEIVVFMQCKDCGKEEENGGL